MQHISASPMVRRISQGELAQLLGYSTKWVRDLELSGRIPPAQRDQKSRRKYWLSDEVETIIRGTHVQPPAPGGRA